MSASRSEHDPLQTDSQPEPDTSALFGRGLLYVVVSALQLVTGALASPVLAHLLQDPAEFGSLSSAIALHQLLVVVAVVGLNQTVTLRRAQDGHDRDARVLAAFALLVATVVTAALWVTRQWWAGPIGFAGSSPLVTATIWWTLPSSAVMVFMGLLLGSDRLRAYSLVSVLAAVGGQALGVALVLSVHPSPVIYAWGLVIADVLAAVLGWVLTRPSFRRSLSWPLIRPALAFSVPLMLGSLSTFVLNAGDRIIIQRLLGAAEVGRYQIAYTVGFVAVQLVVLTSNSWTPRFAAVADELARWRLINRSRDVLYTVLAPMLLGVVLAAPVMLRLFAPASFRPETLLLVVFLVVVSAYPVAALGASGRVLLTQGRSRSFALWTGVAAASNVLLNLALVPLLGIAGAAAATVLAFGAQALGQRAAIGRAAERPPTPRVTLGLSVVVVALAAATTVLPQTTEWNTVRFVLGLACLPWFWRRLRLARTAG